MSERLRLEAEFRDRGVSAGLRKISNELKEVRRTPGMVQAHEWMEKFTERSKEFVSEGGGVGGVLKGIGLGGLVASTSLGELVASFKELGERAADLKEISRQTGLTVDQVNQLQRAGEKLHLNPNQMSNAIEHWSSQAFDFKRHMGELWGELAQQAPDFANKLSFEKPEQQIEDIIAWLGHIRDPELQKRWSELFFGSSEMARLLPNGGRDFAAALKEAQEHTQAITGDFLKKQEAFHESILEFEHSWTDFETSVAPTVFDQLKLAMTDFKAAFDSIKAVYDWYQSARQDPAKAAKTAVDDLDRFLGDKAKEVGDRWRQSGRTSPGAAGFGEDGNALRRNDEVPTGKSGLLHRSAFTSFDGDGGTMGGGALTFAVALREAVKSGTIAAYRELLQQSEVGGEGGGGGGGGFQNASWSGGGRGGGGFNDASGGGTANFKGAMAERANHVMNRLIAKGWTKEAAASAVGQFVQESRVQSDGPSGDHGTAHGLAQWRFDRFKALKDFAAAQGKGCKDLDGQTDFFDHEVHQRGLDAWKRIQDVRQGGRYGYSYERYGDGSHGVRLQNAYGALKGYRPAEATGSDFKLPKGGYWAKDADGNPVAVGPDGHSIQTGRRRQMNLPDAAQKAGAGRMSVEHSGGAEITIKGLPQGTSTQTKTSGMITAVNLQRGPTMISATT